jgi:hypothetical protein
MGWFVEDSRKRRAWERTGLKYSYQETSTDLDVMIIKANGAFSGSKHKPVLCEACLQQCSSLTPSSRAQDKTTQALTRRRHSASISDPGIT